MLSLALCFLFPALGSLKASIQKGNCNVGRHWSVDPSEPTILRPGVQIPSSLIVIEL